MNVIILDIGSDNGLSPGRCQTIIHTNAGILLIQTWGTNFSEILCEIHTFSFNKVHLKMSSAKWQQFCVGSLFTKKMLSYGYRDPNYKPKTVWRPSQVYDRNPYTDKQRVLMHRHQGWNVRHGLCHIYMRYLYIYELFIAFVCFVVCSLL